MLRRPGLFAGAGLLVVLCLGGVYAGLQPRYRLADQTPDQGHAVEANQRLDAKLNGANPIDLFIGFPPGAGLFAPETLRGDRAGASRHGAAAGDRQCLVARNVAPLA